MKKIILFLLILAILALAAPAQAVVSSDQPPVVPKEDIARVETVPAYHSAYYDKGRLISVDRPAHKICFDKTNRKVLCPDDLSSSPGSATIGNSTDKTISDSSKTTTTVPVHAGSTESPTGNQYDGNSGNGTEDQYAH